MYLKMMPISLCRHIVLSLAAQRTTGVLEFVMTFLHSTTALLSFAVFVTV